MSRLAKIKRMPHWLALQTLRLKRDAKGVAAVEFALMVPVMIIMMLGCVETSDALTVSGRMINISGSVADMVSRCTNITAGDLNDVMRISDSLIGHYSRQGLYIQVVAVQADANGVLTVAWSYDRNHHQPLAPGAPYPNLPQGLIGPSGSLIVATASYRYRSPMGHFIHGNINLSHTAYNAPRGSPVLLNNTACAY